MFVDTTTRLVLLAMAEQVIASRGPDEVIRRDGDPYMERWYLLRRADGEIENAYIHRFVRSDAEEPHDHPWANQTTVLNGEYVEEWQHPAFGMVTTPRLTGAIVDRDAGAVHSIRSVAPGTITLFTTAAKEREWGFHTGEGWIHHSQFRAWKNARAGREVISASNAP